MDGFLDGFFTAGAMGSMGATVAAGAALLKAAGRWPGVVTGGIWAAGWICLLLANCTSAVAESALWPEVAGRVLTVVEGWGAWPESLPSMASTFWR